MTDRRQTQRRGIVTKVIEPLEREGEQRESDRRDSPRVPIRLWTRSIGGDGALIEREGNISLGGAYWTTRERSALSEVELRFELPGELLELSALGEVVRLSRQRDGGGELLGVHVRFVVIDVCTELSLAAHLDRSTRLLTLRNTVPEPLAVEWS